MKAREVRIVVGIIQKKFPTITYVEVVDIVIDILQAIDEEREKQ